MNAAAPFVHAQALCESEEVGNGTRIWAFSHVMKGAKVGSLCNVGEQVFIESGASVGSRVTLKNKVLIWEGVHIEDDVFVGPAVVFSNDRFPRSPRAEGVPGIEARYHKKDSWLEKTLVKKGASIGAGAVICPGVTIGEYAMIGAGAVVTKDVKPHSLVLGSPAKEVGKVCFCGLRLASHEIEKKTCSKCAQ